MIICGDCVEIMAGFPENCFDAIVTDPPYGLRFMEKEWDKLDRLDSYNSKITALDIKGPAIQQKWHTAWLTEAIRILKPGASLLAMGGTRTFYRLACAMEDSGFIIKDCLMWIYGMGFPKAQDLGKIIDKRMRAERKKIADNPNERPNCNPQDNTLYKYGSTGKISGITAPATDLARYWDGWKIGGLKPAYEPILWAVKPPGGSYVNNVLKWGVGAVNVEECRVPSGPDYLECSMTQWVSNSPTSWKIGRRPRTFKPASGRFPANVILDDEAGWMLDEQGRPIKPDSGGVSRFFYCAKASKSERDMGMDGADYKLFGQSGGAQRSLMDGDREYKQKHIGLNRIKEIRNDHPTVKPIALFEWLIKLVTRRGQTILDPFLGSGTTMIAAHKAGRRCVGIERELEYCKIAKRRTGAAYQMEIE